MTEDIKTKSYYQDWREALIPRIKEDQAWSDMFDGLSEVFAENIYKYIEQLRYIRDPDKQSREINIQQAEFLGFKYKSDLFTDTEYANLVAFLNMYNRKYKGTANFVNFIGWIKGAKFKIIQLYANGTHNYSNNILDKDPFRREDDYFVRNNSLVLGTGTQEWYPTSHVDMDYNAEEFEIDESDVWYLFYKIAPIHLVLRSVSAVFTAETYKLFMHLSINDYDNTHWCIPCIYRYYAPWNLLPTHMHATTTNNMQYKGYAYAIGSSVRYADLPYIDNNMVASDLKVGTFTRDSNASNIEKDTFYRTNVDPNYPRFEYLPQNGINSREGLGLLIEGQRSNLLLDNVQPITRTVYLYPGNWCFSCHGTYRLVNLNINNIMVETTDEPYLFEITENTRIQVIPLEVPQVNPWFQLELGTFPSSYIPTDEQRIYTREADVLTYQNLNMDGTKQEGTFLITFKDIKADPCTLLKVNKDNNNYILVRKVQDNITLGIYINKQLQGTETIVPYQETLWLSISQKKICFNGEVLQAGNDIVYPTPSYAVVGSNNGAEAIFGHIYNLNYFPAYAEWIIEGA